MQIYICLLFIGFIGSMVAIVSGTVPQLPLIWAATATASAAAVVRRHPASTSSVLAAIAVAELVLGVSAHIASSLR